MLVILNTSESSWTNTAYHQMFCIKLIHIHYHLREGEILAISNINTSPFGPIPFLAPTMIDSTMPTVYGCNFFVDDAGNLQPFEYTTIPSSVTLTAYPEFVADFCATVTQRGLQRKFGLAVKSGIAEHGSWTELDYPEKRATFLLPSYVSIPQSKDVVQRVTKTHFYSPKSAMSDGDRSHSHTEHYHSPQQDQTHESIVEGVTTRDGFFLTGIPLDPASDFYTIVSAIAAAA